MRQQSCLDYWLHADRLVCGNSIDSLFVVRHPTSSAHIVSGNKALATLPSRLKWDRHNHILGYSAGSTGYNDAEDSYVLVRVNVIPIFLSAIVTMLSSDLRI